MFTVGNRDVKQEHCRKDVVAESATTSERGKFRMASGPEGRLSGFSTGIGEKVPGLRQNGRQQDVSGHQDR